MVGNEVLISLTTEANVIVPLARKAVSRKHQLGHLTPLKFKTLKKKKYAFTYTPKNRVWGGGSLGKNVDISGSTGFLQQNQLYIVPI